MKLFTLMLLSVVLMGRLAHGTVQVVWTTGATNGVNGSVELANGTLYAANSLFFAYWSDDMDTSGFNPSAPFNPTDNESFLGAYSSGSRAGRIRDTTTYTFSGYNNGYAYIVAYDMPWNPSYTLTPVAPGDGTAYGVSVTTGPLNAPGGNPPSTPVDFTTVVTYQSPLVLDQTVVPEPATLGLLGAGVAMMAWRRSRQKKHK